MFCIEKQILILAGNFLSQKLNSATGTIARFWTFVTVTFSLNYNCILNTWHKIVKYITAKPLLPLTIINNFVPSADFATFSSGSIINIFNATVLTRQTSSTLLLTFAWDEKWPLISAFSGLIHIQLLILEKYFCKGYRIYVCFSVKPSEVLYQRNCPLLSIYFQATKQCYHPSTLSYIYLMLSTPQIKIRSELAGLKNVYEWKWVMMMVGSI